MGLARKLAERITSLQYDDLPPEAVYWSRIAVLDTIGVTLAGAAEDAPRIVEDVMGLQAGGSSLVFGSSRRVSALDAALVNGTAAHVLDFDNTERYLSGHVSAVMVPALLAGAEQTGSSGRDLLLAHVAGFETGARIGMGVNPYQSNLGWHPTATIGVFAVAAACARLLKLSVDQTETALTLSTSLAAGHRANFGTMAKSLHAGQCARSGLLAALLARKGFTANPDAFEHKQGYLRVFNGDGKYDAARIVASWGAPLDIVAPGASYKLYPCCYSTHSAIQAALNLVRDHGGPFQPDALARVEISSQKTRLMYTDRPAPNTALDAKFSIQYCVARALLDGKVVLEHFDGAAHHDPAVHGLLSRVHAIAYAENPSADGDPIHAEVKITLTDGKTISAKVERPLGRTSADPIPPAQLRAKFEDCAQRVLTPQAAAAAARAIDAFEDVESVRSFTTLLEPAAVSVGDIRRVSGDR